MVYFYEVRTKYGTFKKKTRKHYSHVVVTSNKDGSFKGEFCGRHDLATKKVKHYKDREDYSGIIEVYEAKIVDSQEHCKVKDCNKEVEISDYCSLHYSRYLRNGSVELKSEKGDRYCTIEGCNEKHRAKGLCMKHYHQKRRKNKS